MYFKVTLVSFLAMASFTDLKFGKIPNWLTLPAMVIGIVYHTMKNGQNGLIFSVEGLALGVGLLILPFIVRGMGGGDVKLLGAIGAFVGPVMTIKIFMISAVLGLLISLLLVMTVSEYRRAYFSRIIKFLRRGKTRPDPQSKDRSYPRIYLPYGVVLATGALFSFYLFP